MKRKVLAMVLAAVLAIGITACGSSGENAANDSKTESSEEAVETADAEGGTIVFGVGATLTGNNALNGEYVKNGAQLAADQLNAEGGVLGKQVELVFADEGDDQQTAINACQKLLATENLSGFFAGLSSSYALAMIPYVNEAQIPFMVGGSSANVRAEQSEYTWQPRLLDVNSANVMAKAAVESLEMKNPAILYVNESFGISCYEGVEESLKEEYGIEPAIVISYNANETQFSNMLSQVLSSGADGLIAITTVPMDAATIMSQTADMGFDIPCLGSSGFSNSSARTTAGEKSNGWYCVTDYSPSCIHKSGIAFNDAYVAAYGEASDISAADSYDAIMLLAKAAEEAGSAEPAAINEALANISAYDGALSEGMKSDPETHTFAQGLVLCLNENDGADCTVVESVNIYE